MVSLPSKQTVLKTLAVLAVAAFTTLAGQAGDSKGDVSAARGAGHTDTESPPGPPPPLGFADDQGDHPPVRDHPADLRPHELSGLSGCVAGAQYRGSGGVPQVQPQRRG